MKDENWIAINYFNKEEFYSADTMIKNMDFKFILLLDSLRFKVGFPIIINNVNNDYKGLAVDIKITDDVKRLAIIKYAIELGITRIGIGKDFIHIDNDTDKSSCIWVY